MEHPSIAAAREALEIEIASVQGLLGRLDERFVAVVDLLHDCAGKVVLTGMGKAGIIAHKASATLASTGTPSIWLHLAEAVHGDLGKVEERDVVVVLSYSGATDELRTVLPIVKLIGSKIVAVTGRPESYLAKHADYVLDVSVPKEACPLDLAPTASTTAMLALCDALAVALQKKRGFQAADFAKYHPKGSLGRKLLLRVRDCMRTGERNPCVTPETPVREALLAVTRARAGSCSIAGAEGRLLGIFTDGDLRRHLEKGAEVLDIPVGHCMTAHPVTVAPEMLAVEALRVMEAKKIDELPVVDNNGCLLGLLDVQDLLDCGVI